MRHRCPSRAEARATCFLPQQLGSRAAGGLPPIQGPHVSTATYSAHCWEGLRLRALSWWGLCLHLASLVPQMVESACRAGDPGLSPGLGRSPREGNGYPLQYSCLENSMDRATW